MSAYMVIDITPTDPEAMQRYTEHAMPILTRYGGRVVAFDPDFGTAVIDAPDQKLTRRLLTVNCDGYRHGWMGRRLPGVFQAAGLMQITTEPVTVVLTDYARGNVILALEGTAQRAQAAGLVTAEAGEAWLAQLRDADAAGRFFASLSGFLVGGRA